VGPPAGYPLEPYTCMTTGKPCKGACAESWHKDCTKSLDLCNDCTAGSYRCIGEKKRSMMPCNIEYCDPSNPKYDKSKCECANDGKTGVVGGICAWVPSPTVKRKMRQPSDKKKKCDRFNRAEIGAVIDCPTVNAGETLDQLNACANEGVSVAAGCPAQTTQGPWPVSDKCQKFSCDSAACRSDRSSARCHVKAAYSCNFQTST
jgi:hypothetical protein